MSSKKSQNISSSNTLIAQIILITIVAGAIFVFERFWFKESTLNVDLSGNEAALFIDFENMQKIFSGEVVESMTVLDALNASVAAGKIKLIYNVDADNNTRVIEINDHKTSSDAQFSFYINSRKLNSGELNKTQIKSGDKITITLE